MDQAYSLRRLAQRKGRPGGPGGLQPVRPLRTIAITSGKGGVGKTNVVVNLALVLAKLKRRVLIIDADLGLANVDVVLGINPRYTIKDVLSGEKRLSEVIVRGPGGVDILPAASGVAELSNLSGNEKLMLLQEMDELTLTADVVLIDTAAGISDTVLYFNMAAQDRIVVATGEPTSLTDAYALIKVMHTRHHEHNFKLLVNNVADAREAKEVYKKLSVAADYFLGGLKIDYVGYIPADPYMKKAVMMQKAVVEAFPQSTSSQGFVRLAKHLLGQPAEENVGNIKFFWRRLVNMA